jgi:hypothetical protein
MRVFTSFAKAPMMLPISAKPLPMMKNLMDFRQLHMSSMSCLAGISPSSFEDIGQLANHEENDGA